MLRGMTKDLEFDASGNGSMGEEWSGSMGEEWNRSSNETLSSKSSTCKGGRRKQSKPVKMLRSEDGDETKETAGGADDLTTLSLNVKEVEEVEEEETRSFTGNEIHKFCSARVLSARAPEKSNTEYNTGSVHEESRIIYRKRSDGGKLGDGCRERAHGNSGSLLETDGRPTSAESGFGAQISDPCEEMELKGWSEDRRNSMGNGFSCISSRPGSVIDGEGSKLKEERSSNGDRSRMESRNEEERNFTEVPAAERNENTETHVTEVVRTSRTTDNMAKVTSATPCIKPSGTTNREATFATMSKKGYKSSNRKSGGFVIKECGKSMMKSSNEFTRTLEVWNREPQKTMDISNRELKETMDISNKDLQRTMQISNREPKETKMVLDTGARSRENKCHTERIKTENIRLPSDFFHPDTATNFESQRSESRFDAISRADASEVTETVTDSLQSIVHSQLGHKSLQWSNALQSTCELRVADICKTTMEDYCEICEKRFCNKYYLKKHRQDVHGLASSAAEMMKTAARGSVTKVGIDNSDVHALRFGSDSPTGCSGSAVCSSDVKIPLDSKTLESAEWASFASSSTSTPLLNYLVFSSADVVPPPSLSGSHRERFVFGSSETNRSDMCQSQFTNALSLLSDSLHAGPGGIGFLDAYLRLCCRDIGGRFNGKSEWEQDIYKRHEGDSALFSQSLTDFQTNAFLKFQDNYLAISNARKVAALQNAAMDRSDASCGGIFPRGEKRSFDLFPSTFARKNDDYTSEVMSKLLKAEQFLTSGGTESVKTVSGFASGKLSDRVVCDLCGKEVCNKYFLKTHKTRVHGWQEGASSQAQDHRSSVGLGPFSSTLSYLVDGISSSKHIAVGSSLATTKPPFRRKLAEETQSTDIFFGKGSQTKDSHNGFCTTENTRTMSAVDTGTNDPKSTLKTSPYFPTWSNALTSTIPNPDGADRTQFGQGNHKEAAGVTSRITCCLCSKVVPNKHFLRTHMKRRHGINGSKGDARLSEFNRHSRPSIEPVNSATRIGEDQLAAESKASKSCSWSAANQYINENVENFVNHDGVGSRVVGHGFRKHSPDESRVDGTCLRDEEWEKSASESDVFGSLPVRGYSAARNQAVNSDRQEQTLPSDITDNSMTANQDGETSVNTKDCRQVPRFESATRDRERGESRMQLSPDSDMPSTGTHDLKPKPASIFSSTEGQNAMDRIRCSLCRKRFRSSVQFNIHMRKLHASVLPNPSDSNGTTNPGKPDFDNERSEPKPRGGNQRVASDTVLERGGNSEGSLPFRVESPGKGRGVGARSSMQPFLLREVTGLDLFCPSVVYLPSLRTMTNPTAVTFTLTPMIHEELGQFT